MKNRIYKYEGWSLNNTKNHLWFEEGEGVIAFISKDIINEVELIGLEEVVKYKAEMYEGLDLEIALNKGKYSRSKDRIYSREPFYNFSICMNKVSKVCEENYFTGDLSDIKEIILIKYKANIRKSGLWSNLFNKRRLSIINNTFIEYME